MEYLFFFFNDTATTEIYTLSLHDALPICRQLGRQRRARLARGGQGDQLAALDRSEEHTSELQSRLHLVCRLLLEKKKKCEDRRHRGALSARARPSSATLYDGRARVLRLLH